jgi:hypothetical protein
MSEFALNPRDLESAEDLSWSAPIVDLEIFKAEMTGQVGGDVLAGKSCAGSCR